MLNVLWRVVMQFLASAAFEEAIKVAMQVVPEVERKARAQESTGGKKMTGREKQLAAFDAIEAKLKEDGYNTPANIFVAIEFVLEHFDYFKENKP